MQPNLAEAERRIEEARRTGAESLDLRDLDWLIIDEAVGVPREVLSEEYDENCLLKLRAYFAERQ